MAIKFDIVQKSGAWFDIVNIKTGDILNDSKIQGQANVYTYLEDNTNVLEEVEQLVQEKIDFVA